MLIKTSFSQRNYFDRQGWIIQETTIFSRVTDIQNKYINNALSYVRLDLGVKQHLKIFSTLALASIYIQFQNAS